MKWLSNEALERLRAAAARPDVSGTRYRLLEGLGRGGMGVVWLAEDVQLGRRVALKVLDLTEESSELEARLLREARILARLEHPGIVPVHDVGTLPDGRVFYAMKYVQGRRLDQYLPQIPGLFDRLRIFHRICEAVAFAHARGVLHRDLKPANIMVGAFGEVLVMDWGVAKVLREIDGGGTGSENEGVASSDAPGVAAQTGHGAVLGTPGYMAPEQARGEVHQLDERADIYALGAILWFLTTASVPLTPFTAAVRRDAARRPAGPARSRNRIPRPLAAICAKAMARDPAARYRRTEELMADVARYLDGQPVTAYPENLLVRIQRLYLKHRAAVLLILTYLIVRILLIFLHRP